VSRASSRAAPAPWAGKLSEEKRAEIVALGHEGLTQAEVAQRAGVSKNMVFRALAAAVPTPPAPVRKVQAEVLALEPLARSVAGIAERQAARVGLLTGAEPHITQGASVPSAGALVILPALVARPSV